MTGSEDQIGLALCLLCVHNDLMHKNCTKSDVHIGDDGSSCILCLKKYFIK